MKYKAGEERGDNVMQRRGECLKIVPVGLPTAVYEPKLLGDAKKTFTSL